MGMHMLHEKATDIQQVSRQTRKQDTNIVSLKVLLEWVYDWPVVYWLQLIIFKQSFRNSVTGSVFCFEIVNVLDRWETGKGRGSVTPFGGLRTYNANLPADAAWQAVARGAPHPVSLIYF